MKSRVTPSLGGMTVGVCNYWVGDGSSISVSAEGTPTQFNLELNVDTDSDAGPSSRHTPPSVKEISQYPILSDKPPLDRVGTHLLQKGMVIYIMNCM